MHEILFKAKRKDNGEWVKGYYVCFNRSAHFIYDGYAETDCGDFYPDMFEIDPNTLCQYTGLTDKNGKKIWENDVVNVESCAMGSPYFDGMIGKIIFTECAFFVEPNNKAESTWLFDECAEHAVLGNIFDNPELMKGEER